MRSVFDVRFTNLTLETGAPLLIVAVREPGLHALAPIFWKDRDKVAGEFFQGWERKYALVRLDSFGDLNQAVIFHEYTHSIFHANVHWLPTWLDEGLAEFYGYTRFQGDHIYVGTPSIRYAHLRSEFLIPIPEMLTANGRTFFKDQRRNDLFYGEAWAMVHYMTFGEGMEHGAKLTRFIKLIETGTPQPQAFQQTFGDPKAFESQLSEYIRRFTFAAGVIPSIQTLDPKSFPAKILTHAEADFSLGSIDLGARDIAAARTLFQAAEAADPNLAGPHEELGFLAWRDGHDSDAATEWQKGITADPSSYRSSFALLMSGNPPLSQQTPQQLDKTRHALDAIHATAPKFAPAAVELALVQWRQGQLNLAYKSALEAEKLEPWRAEYPLLTARILIQGHQPAAAADFARQVADRWPGSDHDEAVDVWNLVPSGQARRRPSPHPLVSSRLHHRPRHHPLHLLRQTRRHRYSPVLQPRRPSPQTHHRRPLRKRFRRHPLVRRRSLHPLLPPRRPPCRRRLPARPRWPRPPSRLRSPRRPPHLRPPTPRRRASPSPLTRTQT